MFHTFIDKVVVRSLAFQKSIFPKRTFPRTKISIHQIYNITEILHTIPATIPHARRKILTSLHHLTNPGKQLDICEMSYTFNLGIFLNAQNRVADPEEHFMISPKYLTEQSGKSFSAKYKKASLPLK